MDLLFPRRVALKYGQTKNVFYLILKAKIFLTPAIRKLCCLVAQIGPREYSAPNPLQQSLQCDLGKSLHGYVSIFFHLQNLANPTK